MTLGSPLASAALSSGVDETNASCLLSGDQLAALPVPGSGLFVPLVGARNVMPVPSGRAIRSPWFSPWLPENASHFPSGDQSGLLPLSFSPPRRTEVCVAISTIQSCPLGRPGRSRIVMVYAIRFPSGESATLPTERRADRSRLE